MNTDFGFPVFGDPVQESAVTQIMNARETGARVALMADHHVGYGIPIGGVAAWQEHISPHGVGSDIACGNKAVRLDAPAKKIGPKMHTIMDDIVRRIGFGLANPNNQMVEHELFDDPLWKELTVLKKMRQKAQRQLGTVGGGNHYVDVFADEEDRIWVGVHFGSRGLGHAISEEFKELATDTGTGVGLLHVRSAAGEDYLRAMELAGRYAYAGRDWVCATVARIIGGKVQEEVHNHHNFAWRETHDGEDLWVVRKGATPAFPGQKGFVGASMAESAVILEGVDSEQARSALRSTVHGAGRVMSRSAAKGRNGQAGLVSERAMMKSVEEAKVVLRGGGVDESMHVYKRLDEVLACHAESVRILHRLRPLGVAM
ncbi:MAG: RtcB family protein, partial [Fimbriimonadaceae bacterium]|nr:RtcB family protein [Fimbriimonadaceae bacterium]